MLYRRSVLTDERQICMNASILLALAGIVAGGAMLAAQAPVNAALARALGNALIAACMSFGVGFVALAIISVLRGAWPSAAALAAAPWWAWIGGLLGAAYVALVIWAVPKLGVVTMIAALVFGQLVAALVLDSVGAFGMPVTAISWQRVMSVVLVLGGLVLSRAG
jgi:bacterial/archaeal transporter family-2 protein